MLHMSMAKPLHVLINCPLSTTVSVPYARFGET